jgi:acetyl esterase/lipase
MNLWSSEIDAMRPGARAAVADALAEATTGELDWSTHRETDELAAFVSTLRRQAAVWYPQTRAVNATSCVVGGAPCRVIVPGHAEVDALYVHFHGGGMIRGAPAMSDATNAYLSERFGMTVVSVDYRLAPEHPFPAAIDDGLLVAQWLLEDGGRRFGTTRLLVGGESSGAHVAAAVLLRLRDAGTVGDVLGANLMYGMFDWGRSASQRGIRPSRAPDALDPERLRFFADCYLPGRSDDERRDPAVSVAFADLGGLPSAFFSVGSADHLFDDTLVTAARCAAFGNIPELFVAPDMPHGFDVFPCEITTAWRGQRDRWFSHVLSGATAPVPAAR